MAFINILITHLPSTIGSAPSETATLGDLLASAHWKYQQQDYHGALELYSQLLDLEPNNPKTLCFRGITYYRLGNRHQAMVDYHQAIAIDPHFALAYYRRGYLQYLNQDFTASILDDNKAIELQPDFAMAYANRAYAYRELYGDQEAMIDLRWAAKLFKKQGNLAKYQSILKSIESIGGDDSCASGML